MLCLRTRNFGLRKVAVISLRDSWYLYGDLHLTLHLETTHLVIHKYELIVIRSTSRAGRRDTAKTITVLFQFHKKIVTWALTHKFLQTEDHATIAQ